MSPGIEGRRAEPDWFQSRWPAILALTGLAALFVLLAGNPVESWERQWFDCALRWRLQLGWLTIAKTGSPGASASRSAEERVMIETSV